MQRAQDKKRSVEVKNKRCRLVREQLDKQLHDPQLTHIAKFQEVLRILGEK